VVKKAAIKPDRRNARLHPERNLEAVEQSLKELGAGRSIVVDRNGVIIGGNAVYEKAKELGIPIKEVETDGSELVVVRRVDLDTDDPRRKALALADNQIALLAEWDNNVLWDLKEELTGQLDLTALGFPALDLTPPSPFTEDEAGASVRNPFLAGYRYFPIIVPEEDAEIVETWFNEHLGECNDGLSRGQAFVKWMREDS